MDGAMPNADDFRAELRRQIERALRQKRPHIEVNAGELHRAVGGYPPKRGQPHHAMASCCNIMRAEMARWKSEVVYETASGHAPALTIRYYLRW
jgi:hypothetical protein